MSGSGASRHTTSGGLSPSGKVYSLLSRNRGVVLPLSSSRVKMPGKWGMLGSGALANTLAMVSQVFCTGEGQVGLEGWCATRLYWGGGEGRSWGGWEYGCSLLYGPGHARLEGLRWRSPERIRVPCPLLGQPSLSVCLDLQDIDGGCQSADALQDLVDLTRPCSWRLMTGFVGQEIPAVLFFLLFLSTGF